MQHRVEGALDPASLGLEAHVGGEQRPRAQGLGQDQPVARAHARLAQHVVLVGQAVDGKAERQFGAFRRVAADEGRVGRLQHLQRAVHHLEQLVLDLRLQPVGHGGDGQRRLGLGPHGEDVAEAVVGGDLSENVRVVDERAEEIHRVDHHLAGRHMDHRRVVGFVKPDQDVVALDRLHAAQRPGEHGGPHLGAATAAPHGDGGDFLERLGIHQPRGDVGRLVGGHLGKLAVLAHPAAVDPVLPAPHEASLHRQVVLGRHRVLVAGADDGEELFLRGEGFQGPVEQRAAQVFGQGRTLADREHARFRARVVDHGGDVAGGEDLRVGYRLQRVPEQHETVLVHLQAGVLHPGRGAGRGHPQDFVERDGVAVGATDAFRIRRHHRMPRVHADAAHLEQAGELFPGRPVVGGQDAF